VEVQVTITVESVSKEKVVTAVKEIFNHNDCRFSLTAERNNMRTV
jgi:hypothetical protein